ncbi:NADPH:quinone reductase [Spiractinospora alimapuensis]|uniref:NADPH:quinone reductase n=1 Tax=Spiractinospora alimapuensis TaxID=2820884 RepID=UPI001F2CC9C6|nr:NADPH:quinone reductase [Spiractinospora alimapuensis]QVQ50758.1 NADPH:quinone reductase [Spiractinospora alimapuensis]
MRAIVFTEHGPPEVLHLVEREPRQPGPGQVRIRVLVSAVNPTDWKQRKGVTPGESVAATVPNQDGAGVVDAVGPGVRGVAVGDHVWVLLASHYAPDSGTAQQYTILPEERVVVLPEGVDFTTGAAIGIPAVTAHRALTVAEDGPRRLVPGALEGMTVLVSGGAGAVGHAAIQLARWAGATVLTTVSNEEKATLARAAGAQHVFRYTERSLEASIREIAPEGVDIVVEVAAGANAELNCAVVRERGTVAIYGNERGGGTVSLDFGRNLWLNTRYQFLVLYTVGLEALRAGAEDVTAALRDGALPVGAEHGLPVIRFPLERADKAHAAVESGVVGKVVIDVPH